MYSTLLWIDRRTEGSEDTQALSSWPGQTDTYRTLHGGSHTFLPNRHRTFTKMDHVLGRKPVSANVKDSSHAKHVLWPPWNETGNKQQKDIWKIAPNICKLNNPFLNNSRVQEGTKGGIKKSCELIENEEKDDRKLWDSVGQCSEGNLCY